MARKRTIHTQADTPAMLNVFFKWAELNVIMKDAPTSGHVDFHCPLGAGYEKLFERMEWQIPEPKTTRQDLEAKLEGGYFVIAAKDKLVTAEAQVRYKFASGFHVQRFELKGKKGKGFRLELRFRVTIEEVDALAKLEAWWCAVAGTAGELKLMYLDAPEQLVIPEGDQQLIDQVQQMATSRESDVQ